MASKRIRILWFIMIYVFLIASCRVSNNKIQITKDPSTQLITPSFSPMPTSTIVGSGNTNTHAFATPTMIAPTFTTKEKEKLISHLLTVDYQCNLPCFGGIEPGVTTWPDAKTFLQQFADIYSNNNEYSAEMNYKGENLVLAFYTQENIVEAMQIPRFEYPLYRLLQDYGKPDEVYFYVLDVLPIDIDNPYTVYLFYKEKGIVAEYTGASAKGTTISVCFRDSQGRQSHRAFLSLWSEGSDKTFESVIVQYMNKFSDYSSLKYRKLEELSTYTTNDFFKTYKLEENENHCLKIQNPNPKPS